MPNRRFVKLVIIDPDARLEPEQALVYESEKAILTDLDDAGFIAQHEPPMKLLLEAHNKMRGETIDQAQDRKFEKTVYLENNLDMDDLTVAVLTYVATDLTHED